MYSSVVQLLHVGWKIIEYIVVHATSYVLYCTFRCMQRLLGIRVYCAVVHSVQAADTSLLFECTMLHSKP